jgi:hypothetical protein
VRDSGDQPGAAGGSDEKLAEIRGKWIIGLTNGVLRSLGVPTYRHQAYLAEAYIEADKALRHCDRQAIKPSRQIIRYRIRDAVLRQLKSENRLPTPVESIDSLAVDNREPIDGLIDKEEAASQSQTLDAIKATIGSYQYQLLLDKQTKTYRQMAQERQLSARAVEHKYQKALANAKQLTQVSKVSHLTSYHGL